MVRALDDAGFRLATELRQDRAFMDSVMQHFADAYETHCGRRSQLYPEVLETLQALRHLDLPLAMVTNKESRLTERVLDAHGLRTFFDLVVAGDTLARSKPDPLPLQHCLDHFRVAANRAVLVGDSSVDVAAARAAGVPCWAVPYGYNRGRPVREAGPNRLIDDISAVLTAVSANAPRRATANTLS